MVKCPLEQVTGSSFRRFLSVADRDALRPLMKRAAKTGAKIQVQLIAEDGARLPVQISVQEQARAGFERVTIGMVVTDMTEARRTEELLRALTHRIVQVQEVERGRVALELHDNITQLLCAVIFRSQALTDSLSGRDGPARQEAVKLRAMLGETAAEVERISRDLRPSVLDQLGLIEAVRERGREFARRTGVAFSLTGRQLNARLPADIELGLYRILQEALGNVERHARARRVTVEVSERGGFVQLTIQDNGIGFDPERSAAGGKGGRGLGLLSMRERAAYVRGVFSITSVRRTGTKITVRIPRRQPAG